ncbi:MAG: UDP-N-acetylmuramoyl-L-alanyl-D-glutamate--2,6-diaminopimelate ligase [Spirochaetales bacterium]|jgi:UDP-N-acetylmuramoyl-L-alanyl-D-glutamate--2,6-diaminopimelate ligase|nr:UDP-N-acetylmuramoyl-L-alanyl-D-glutamate--2,6-diaminopimelate ligase [Spirochaetales bacterium]
MQMRLSALISNINITERHGELDPEIHGLSYDAFTVRAGELFFAVEGINADRHLHIPDVVDAGITAIIHSKPLTEYAAGVTYLRVQNVQKSMSPVSAAFYGMPSQNLFVFGITGTNGKSTTASYIYQLLGLCGKKAGILSSVYHDFGTGLEGNLLHQSTPEAPSVQKVLREAVDNGVDYMVLEATSHGLSARNDRVADVYFDAVIMTNVTHEHLEFHGTMEQYAFDKANLFRIMDSLGGAEGFGIVNSDDAYVSSFLEASRKKIFSYGLGPRADLRASGIKSNGKGMDFEVEWQGVSVPAFLPGSGKFNIQNALAAVLAVSIALKRRVPEILKLVADLQGIYGRMNALEAGQPFSVFIDFAHTPDSFNQLIPEMKQASKGKLITLFGSAGERDTSKRRIQGEIAAKHSDIVVLTDEDPRGENPENILEEIAAGCAGLTRGKNLFLVPGRNKGIYRALEIANPGDTVLLLGKGHETSIVYAEGEVEWNETEAAKQCLQELGYC